MTSTDSVCSIERWWNHLACPECKGKLERHDTKLTCSPCAKDYPIREGRPVFIDNPETVQVMDPNHISNVMSYEAINELNQLEGTALNLGAGGSNVKFANLCELEYSIFRHTDVSADAHRLPFADNVFDAVYTFNTFEHLYDPKRAAEEILRVLKPDGKLMLHTAFLQPVHEPPYHFYNTTEYGLRRWLKGFEITELKVTENFQPAFVLGWLTSAMLYHIQEALGPEAAAEFANTPLEFWQKGWADPDHRSHKLWKLLAELPQESQKQFSAGFAVKATKPRAA